MAYQDRRLLIQELQEIRKSKVVSNINSDRRPVLGSLLPPALTTQLATEAQPVFYSVLRELGKHPVIDLFLYTGGGQTDSVWPLVSLMRAFGTTFNVLVPYCAHSAGTLICLGADNIVLGEASELSPVDPSTGNQFNPVDEIDKQTRRAISVEEVASFFDLARDPSRVSEIEGEDNKSVDINLAFKLLVENVHPLALGNVNRSHKQIRELAKRLLSLHLKGRDAEEKTKSIVNSLTQGRYSHTDILNRHEVQELLGENTVRFADDREQLLMWNLLEDYVNSISMRQPYSLQGEIGDQQQAIIDTVGAFIETEKTSFIYCSKSKVTQRSVLPPNFQVNLQSGQLMPLIPGFPREFQLELLDMGWIANEEGI
jgi:ATP-dependent protease ClpP protease subunit